MEEFDKKIWEICKEDSEGVLMESLMKGEIQAFLYVVQEELKFTIIN